MSIRIILFVAVTVMLVAVESVGTWIGNRHVKIEMEALSRQQLNVSALVLRDTLIEMMRMGVDDEDLHNLYARFRRMQGVRDLRVWVAPSVVRDHDLQTPHHIIDDRPEWIGLAQDSPRMFWQSDATPPTLRFLHAVLAEEQCLQCHVSAQEGDMLGVIDIDIDMSQVQQAVVHNQWEQQTIAIAELGLMLALLLLLGEWLVFRHLRHLREGMERMMSNGHTLVAIPGESGNEIGALISGFNRMAQRIRDLLLEQRNTIATQTQELSVLLETSHALSGAVDPLRSLDRLAENLTRASETAACQILLWQEGQEGRVLERQGRFPVRTLPAIADPAWATVRLNECPVIARILEERRHKVVERGEIVQLCDRQVLLLGGGRAALAIPLLSRSEVLGLVVLTEFRDADRAPITPRKIELCKAMVFQAGAALEDVRLHDRLVKQFNESALAMAEAVDKKSPWTAGHSRRVTQFALRLGKALGWEEERLELLRIAGLLHYIGKIVTPGAILNKGGRLDDAEFAAMRRHPVDGAQILGRMTPFKPIIPFVRHHHERFDGRGYPDGLRGTEIPIEARVLAVADAFDAMIADRPYRKAMSWNEALDQLHRGSGSQFDPGVVAVALTVFSDQAGDGWVVGGDDAE